MTIEYYRGNLIVSVNNEDELEEVKYTLDLIEKILCMSIDYDVTGDYEISVSVADYDEYRTIKSRIYDHCSVV